MDIFDELGLENIERPKIFLKFDYQWVDICISRRPQWEPRSLNVDIGYYPDGVNFGRKLYSHLGLWKYDFYFQVGKRERI